MKNILTIAKWETTRLRSRFSGKSRYIVLAVMLLAAAGFFLIYQQGFVICKGLYVVGASANAAEIADERFSVFRLDRETGNAELSKRTIDVYIDGDRVVSRSDQRSQYAAGALKKYLEKLDLARIVNQYEINQAFPLRVEVRYLESPEIRPGLDTSRSPAPTAEPVEPATPLSTPVPPGEAKAEKPVPPSSSSPASGSPDGSSVIGSNTDAAVKQQLEELETNQLPQFKAEFVSGNDIIIPSLMTPPIPLAQVLIALLYIIPIFLVSVFFTSSFTEEKVNRKLIVLLSTPVTSFQVILGKMLPYLIYSLIAMLVITVTLGGNVLLGLVIFIPVMLFIFSMYLIVALTYRTFKDQTFFSVLVLSFVTVYLVAPAMLVGVNDLSYISPLTLAVQMYRGESFGANEYFLSTVPLYLLSFLVVFVGTRVLNEEYLMSYKPLHIKAADALHLAMDKSHLSISVIILSVALIPLVFMLELAVIVFVYNLGSTVSLWLLLAIAAFIEETAKSVGVVVLLRGGTIRKPWDVSKLAVLSALGFFLGEKLLLFLALSVISETLFISAVFNTNLLLLPLVLHVVGTCAVCLLTSRLGVKYYLTGIMAGSVIHFIYNVLMIRASL